MMGRFVLRRGGVELLLLLLACLFPATASALVEPLPASNYTTETVCGPSLGLASCLADGLVPETEAARSRSYPIGMTLPEAPAHGKAAEGVYGLRPEDLHAVYKLPDNAPDNETIGIVDAFDDPTIENDLRVYDEEFGLPECTEPNGCFHKVNESGNASPLPAVNVRWAAEIALDVEVSHAVCQSCNILLVEAERSDPFSLEMALTNNLENATEISNNFGSVTGFTSSLYNHPGRVITAPTGDSGYDNWEELGFGSGADYPALVPFVIAVGGTRLSPFNGTWAGETAWSSTGSGCGTNPGQAPSWQTALTNWTASGCGGERAVADIAADADPESGVAIYDSTSLAPWFPGWATLGGTSLASSIVNAAFALAGGTHGVEYPAKTLYAHGGSISLHDITSGTNLPAASCHGELICSAEPGWDGPTGVGTLRGLAALQPLVGTEPTVTGRSSGSGPWRGGQVVELLGIRLAGATAVHFGGAEGAILTDEEDSMTVEVPTHPPGIVDMTVTGSGGIVSETSSADQYEFTTLKPEITRVSPPVGPPFGGTLVTIEGTDLGEIENVEFSAGYFVTPSSVGENRVTAISPAHPEGTFNLRLFGGYASAFSSFTYGQLPHDTLAIHLVGSGQGAVAVAPFGAACSSDCVQSFEVGAALTLSATPRSGSTFTGWSGEGCSGTAFCHFVLRDDTEISATFEAPASTGTPASKNSTTSTTGAGDLTLHPGNASALKGCLDAAHKAYRHAARLAHSAGSGRAAALHKAKRAEYKAVVSCRRRY